MYHIFIHASLSGHLGCFCVPAVVNSAAVNTGVRVPFPVMVFLGWMPNSGITGPCGSFTPSFLRNPHIVLHMVVLIYTHTNSAGGFPFLHTFSSSYCCKFFDDGRSDWCEVIPLYSFGSHFLIMSIVEHLLMCLLAICMSSWRNVCLGLPPIF